MKLGAKILFVCLITSLLFLACSEEKYEIVNNENTNTNSQTSHLEFTYKDIKYSSFIDTSESENFLTDKRIDSIYKELIKKPGVVISVNSDCSWEIFDNEEEYNTKNKKNVMQSKSIIDLEYAARSSRAYLYEHTNFLGKQSYWEAFYIKDDSGIQHVNLEKGGFNDMMSSFKIYNDAFFFDLKAYFMDLSSGGTGDYDHCIVVFIKPRSYMHVNNVAKTFGSKTDDRASSVQFDFFKSKEPVTPPEEFAFVRIDYRVLAGDSFSVKDTIIAKYEIYNNNNYRKPFDVKFSRYTFAQRAYFRTATNNNVRSYAYIGVPIFENGQLNVNKLTEKDFEFVENDLQINRQMQTEAKTDQITLNPYEKYEVRLMGKKYKMNITYFLTTKSVITGGLKYLEGKLIYEGNKYEDIYIAYNKLN